MVLRVGAASCRPVLLLLEGLKVKATAPQVGPRDCVWTAGTCRRKGPLWDLGALLPGGSGSAALGPGTSRGQCGGWPAAWALRGAVRCLSVHPLSGLGCEEAAAAVAFIPLCFPGFLVSHLRNASLQVDFCSKNPKCVYCLGQVAGVKSQQPCSCECGDLLRPQEDIW